MAVSGNGNFNRSGGITYGKNVLRSIITLAAKEITGVASLQGKEIKYEIVGSTLNVDVYLSIYYGHSVSDVAYRVQENIKRSIETMSGFKVGIININILSVAFEDELRVDY